MSLPEAKVAENGVTRKTIQSIEETVYGTAAKNLSQYLFKVHKLPIIQKIKTIINLPIKQADPTLDAILRKIRYICNEITTTKWRKNGDAFYVHKIYFSSTHWLTLNYVEKPTN